MKMCNLAIIFALYIYETNNELILNSIIPFLLVHYGVIKDLNDSSLYSGYFSAAYYIGQFICNIPFERFAEKYGKKNVMLFGTATTIICNILFAFSNNLYTSLLIRFVYGLLNANFCLIRIFISEISETNTIARNYGYLTCAWAIGAFIAPITSMTYDETMKYPALYPLCISSMITFIIFVITFVYLDNPQKHVLSKIEQIEMGVNKGEIDGINKGEIDGINKGEIDGINKGEIDGINKGEIDGINKEEIDGVNKGEIDGINKGEIDGINKGEIDGINKVEIDGINKGEIDGINKGEIDGVNKGEIDGINKGEIDGINKGEIDGINKGETLATVSIICVAIYLLFSAAEIIYSEISAVLFASQNYEYTESQISLIFAANNFAGFVTSLFFDKIEKLITKEKLLCICIIIINFMLLGITCTNKFMLICIFTSMRMIMSNWAFSVIFVYLSELANMSKLNSISQTIGSLIKILLPIIFTNLFHYLGNNIKVIFVIIICISMPILFIVDKIKN
jgi:MFS family permease